MIITRRYEPRWLSIIRYPARPRRIIVNYNHFGAIGLVGYLTYPARPHCTQICVHPRTFMTLRVAQFSLEIAHLFFRWGRVDPPLTVSVPDSDSWCNTKLFLRRFSFKIRFIGP